MIMDRAYEGNETQQLLFSMEVQPVVPPNPNRLNPWEYDKELYKKRNEVERLFRRLKAFRRIFSRFEKLDVMFTAFIHIAFIFDALLYLNRTWSRRQGLCNAPKFCPAATSAMPYLQSPSSLCLLLSLRFGDYLPCLGQSACVIRPREKSHAHPLKTSRRTFSFNAGEGSAVQHDEVTNFPPP